MISRHTTGAAVGLVVIILTAAAFSQGQSSERAAPPNVRQEVLARLAEIQEAAQALDPDKVFSFVLENDAGALAQNGELLLTRQEALESTKQGFRGLRSVEYQFDDQHITLLAPNVALATGEGVTSASTDDGRTFSTRFAQSVILIQTNRQWKVFHAHRSFPPRN